MSEPVKDERQDRLARIRSMEVISLVQQHMPDDYMACVELDPATDLDDEVATATLSVRWASRVLPANMQPLAGSLKMRVADIDDMTPEQIAQQVLDLVGMIARRGLDFGEKWEKQHGETASAMQVANTWEESMRFRCKLAAGRINKRLDAECEAQTQIWPHSTEIISPTYYQVAALLTVKNSEGNELVRVSTLLCSSERNSVDEIVNYFCKHTDLKQILKPDVEEGK